MDTNAERQARWRVNRDAKMQAMATRIDELEGKLAVCEKASLHNAPDEADHEDEDEAFERDFKAACGADPGFHADHKAAFDAYVALRVNAVEDNARDAYEEVYEALDRAANKAAFNKTSARRSKPLRNRLKGREAGQ